MCRVLGHRTELDHWSLVGKSLFTHSFSTPTETGCVLWLGRGGVGGQVSFAGGRGVGRGMKEPHSHASGFGKSRNPEKMLLAPSMPSREFFSVACRKTFSPSSSLRTMPPVVTWKVLWT